MKSNLDDLMQNIGAPAKRWQAGEKLFRACGVIRSDNKIDRFAAPKL